MRKVERQLREQIHALEADLKELEADREKFRLHFTGRFRWWIKLVGEGKSPSLPYLVEADAKFLTTVQWWCW